MIRFKNRLEAAKELVEILPLDELQDKNWHLIAASPLAIEMVEMVILFFNNDSVIMNQLMKAFCKYIFCNWVYEGVMFFIGVGVYYIC